MRRRASIVLVIAVAASFALLGLPGATPPAHADAAHAYTTLPGGRGISQVDPSLDATFSSSCVDDGEPGYWDSQLGVPVGTGQEVGNCHQYIDVLDLTGYSARYIPATSTEALDGPVVTGTEDLPTVGAKVATLEFTWTMAASWPQGNENLIRGTDDITGLTVSTQFRNPALERNDLWPHCDRLSALYPGDSSSTDHPKWVNSIYGAEHWDDWHYLYISLFWDRSAGATGNWTPTIAQGYYSAWADDGLRHSIVDYKNDMYRPVSADPFSGNGTFYSHSVVGNTITLKVPAVYQSWDNTCISFYNPTNNSRTGRGISYSPFAMSSNDRANRPTSLVTGEQFPWPGSGDDSIEDLRATAGTNTLIPPPQTIPTSQTTGPLVCDPLDQGTHEAFVVRTIFDDALFEPTFKTVDDTVGSDGNPSGDGKNDAPLNRNGLSSTDDDNDPNNDWTGTRCVRPGFLTDDQQFWLLSSSSVVDATSTSDGSLSAIPGLVGNEDLLVSGFGGVTCVLRYPTSVPGATNAEPVFGTLHPESAGAAGEEVRFFPSNPLATPGEHCALQNPFGGGIQHNSEASFTALD